MHIAIKENKLFNDFNNKRTDLGFTTVTSAIVEAMRIFNNYDFTKSKPINNSSDNINNSSDNKQL